MDRCNCSHFRDEHNDEDNGEDEPGCDVCGCDYYEWDGEEP